MHDMTTERLCHAARAPWTDRLDEAAQAIHAELRGARAAAVVHADRASRMPMVASRDGSPGATAQG